MLGRVKFDLPADLADKEWIYTEEVARCFQVTPFTVRRWCRESVGPKFIQRGAFNGVIMFRPADVKEWAETVYLTDRFRRNPQKASRIGKAESWRRS